MEIGIVGLGLIGGSLAKAISQNTDNTVYGADLSDQVVKKAVLVGAIEQPLTDSLLSQCDIIIAALYPQATIDYIKEKAHLFKKGCIVVDCGGVKRIVCRELIPFSEEQGFLFVGGHPMAGLEHSGFTYAKRSLFNNASMIFTPTKGPIESMETLKKLFTSIGFTNIEISTPQDHDRKIAFTSQLAHVVSNAYIKSPAALEHAGFSAGSYRDLTRVAKLNEDMWTELFLENADNLVREIDILINNLKEYRDAIKTGDSDTLRALLRDGREKKALIDGEVF
ncbi:MAG TPA: prephenate dehydrogenase/arogenate dehydrogenase family protein [Candidatus Copromorpha excrementigallinarum]|uniref:Prephenate dehydrogenase/arogenate dehydrogenase family protein n=1 Tax=Candidatus Allocopromorpha excrementigallinarum TaxID=2840742 RepID=A0A9D1I4B1_9FIRM|nr:prephenate dehydrogenase/arogenate dehydrogenase family protein [Candidatus Copromorpha excrementigallinarum]